MSGHSPAAQAEQFIGGRRDVEGVAMRIGAHHAQLLLVAPSGEWKRVVVGSPAAAHKLAARLSVPCHDAWPDGLRRAMSSWQRGERAWERAPYPERSRSGV